VSAEQLKWLERILGFNAEGIPEDADVQFMWTNMPQSLGVFAMIAVVASLAALVLLLYWWEMKSCPHRVRIVLAAVRIAVLLLLTVVFLGPALTYFQRRTRMPAIVVMRDDSQSMRTADRYLDDETAEVVAAATGRDLETVRQMQPTRASLVDEMLEKDDGRLRAELRDRGNERVFDFHLTTTAVRVASAAENPSEDAGDKETGDLPAALPPLQATGPGTDFSQAVEKGLSHGLTAAIVIFTDGQHTGAEDPRIAAEKAADQNVPLLIVGVGDPAPRRNLRVADVYVDRQVWRGDPFEIKAVIDARGVEPAPAMVELLQRKLGTGGAAATAGKVIQRREITLPEGDGQVRLVFSHSLEVAGSYEYLVRIEPLEDEEAEDNISKRMSVKVLSEQARVLLIAGAPTWEYQMVQRVLTRDKLVNLSCWLQTMDPDRAQEGNTVINRLPDTREDMFKYDVIMLFDPDPQDFDAPWIELLKQFNSEHAGGVLYAAGPKYAGRFLDEPQTRRMRDVLPVRLGDVGAMEVASLLATNTRAWPLGIVAHNVGQPVMRFFPDAKKSLQQWERLPGIYWSFPAQEAKPVARVMIEHSDPTLRRVEGSRPLLVTGQYGSGRTVYLGFNGTWRWRRIGPNAEFFRRFWVQTTQFLVRGRSLEGKRRGEIETDRPTYDLGQRVAVVARLKDRTYLPLALPAVEAIQYLDGAVITSETLKLVPGQPGQYEATITAKKTGTHTLTITLADDASAQPAAISTEFNVDTPSAETNDVRLNEALLREIAEASGGAYFRLDELDQLPDAVPDRRQTIVVPGKPVLLWDNRFTLILLALLLTVEWGVRKWFKLL